MVTRVESSNLLSRPIRPLPQLPPLLSFFSGAGFLDLGMINAGFQVIWSQEIDPRICEAHDFGMTRYFSAEKIASGPVTISSREDIQHKGPRQIRREAFGTFGRGDTFGMIGGPPCPDFSVGGKNQGGDGERGRLTRVFVERICELDPLFFLIENVKGLISTRKHWGFLLGEVHKLEEKGYAVDLAVLNALDLGVPQDRERLFVVGVRRNLIRKIYSRALHQGDRDWFPWPRDERYHGAKARYRWPKMTPFGSSPAEPENIPRELFVGPLVLNQDEISALPNGNEGFRPHSSKFYEIPEGDVSGKSFKRLHRFRYSPTASYGNNEVHLHPALPRRLSVREAMRIQTIPDSYALPLEMPLSTKFKIVGNGVPVRLAQRVGQALSTFVVGASAQI